MKIASYTAIIIVISWSALTVAEIWGDVISTALYWKITITMALVGGGIILAALIKREYLSDKQMKKDKFID